MSLFLIDERAHTNSVSGFEDNCVYRVLIFGDDSTANHNKSTASVKLSLVFVSHYLFFFFFGRTFCYCCCCCCFVILSSTFALSGFIIVPVQSRNAQNSFGVD